MSALRVRYDLMQLAAALHRGERCTADVEHRLVFTKDAFDDWRNRYPRDTWLPQTAYRFAGFEAEIGTPAALQTAHDLLELTAHDLGANKWAQMAKDDLHRGLPRPTPLPSGTPVPCATPAPSPSPELSATPSVAPSAEPSVAPSAEPSVAPSTEPSAAPSAAGFASPSSQPAAETSPSPAASSRSSPLSTLP